MLDEQAAEIDYLSRALHDVEVGGGTGGVSTQDATRRFVPGQRISGSLICWHVQFVHLLYSILYFVYIKLLVISIILSCN